MIITTIVIKLLEYLVNVNYAIERSQLNELQLIVC
jgi:hypothetical protein